MGSLQDVCLHVVSHLQMTVCLCPGAVGHWGMKSIRTQFGKPKIQNKGPQDGSSKVLDQPVPVQDSETQLSLNFLDLTVHVASSTQTGRNKDCISKKVSPTGLALVKDVQTSFGVSNPLQQPRVL